MKGNMESELRTKKAGALTDKGILTDGAKKKYPGNPMEKTGKD